MNLTIKQAAQTLLRENSWIILTHKKPDGDTLGAGFGLARVLLSLGKEAVVFQEDEIPQKFSYLCDGVKVNCNDIKGAKVVAVDVADRLLLGSSLEKQFPKIDLCIDHHLNNRTGAEQSCVYPELSSACELTFAVAQEMNAEISKGIADCFYTGICTDTGCFLYSTVSPNTHKAAARLMELGARASQINENLFQVKSLARISLERQVLDNLKLFEKNRVAIVVVTDEMMKNAGADESTFDGIPAIARSIEGVDAGVTIRQMADGYKISVRTSNRLNAAEICENFGGGGHVRAAGCVIKAPLSEVEDRLLEQIRIRL